MRSVLLMATAIGMLTPAIAFATQRHVPRGPRADRFWADLGPQVVADQWADEAVVCGLRSRQWATNINNQTFDYAIRIANNLWGSDTARIRLNMKTLDRVQAGSRGMAQDAPAAECLALQTNGWLPRLDEMESGD